MRNNNQYILDEPYRLLTKTKEHQSCLNLVNYYFPKVEYLPKNLMYKNKKDTKYL